MEAGRAARPRANARREKKTTKQARRLRSPLPRPASHPPAASPAPRCAPTRHPILTSGDRVALGAGWAGGGGMVWPRVRAVSKRGLSPSGVRPAARAPPSPAIPPCRHPPKVERVGRATAGGWNEGGSGRQGWRAGGPAAAAASPAKKKSLPTDTQKPAGSLTLASPPLSSLSTAPRRRRRRPGPGRLPRHRRYQRDRHQVRGQGRRRGGPGQQDGRRQG